VGPDRGPDRCGGRRSDLGFGHYSQNYQQAYNGRKGLLVSGAAALIIGAAPAIISFFNTLGTGMSKAHP
jgi:hypothetical protein